MPVPSILACMTPVGCGPVTQRPLTPPLNRNVVWLLVMLVHVTSPATVMGPERGPPVLSNFKEVVLVRVARLLVLALIAFVFEFKEFVSNWMSLVCVPTELANAAISVVCVPTEVVNAAISVVCVPVVVVRDAISPIFVLTKPNMV